MRQDSPVHQLPVTNSHQLEQQLMRKQHIANHLLQILLEYNFPVVCLLRLHRLAQLEHVQIMEFHRLAAPPILLIAVILV